MSRPLTLMALAAVLAVTAGALGACTRPGDESASSTLPVTAAPSLTSSVPTSSTQIPATTSARTTTPPSSAPSTSAQPTSTVTTTAAPTTTTTVAATTLAPTTTTAPATTSAPTTSKPAPTTSKPATTAPTTTRPPTSPALVIDRGTSGRHEVALTFDAGSDVGFAEAILDYLDAEGIRVSFGMTGSWAEDNPALVARMADAGHVLMNHTASHPHMTAISSDDRLAELASADATVSAITGRSMQPYFRPPFGEYDASVLADIARAGYTYSVMWTVDSLGWKGLDPDDVTQRCLDRAVDGAILMFHVGSASTDFEALPDIVAGLRADGYSFVTIPQLLQP